LLAFDDTTESNESAKDYLDVLFPITKNNLSFLKVYLCPFSKCADVLEVFGIDRSALPRALIHDTVQDVKYVQKPVGDLPRHGAGIAVITRETMEMFINESLGTVVLSENSSVDREDLETTRSTYSPGKVYSTKEVDAILSVGNFAVYRKRSDHDL
jgi:hypothetical protein